MVPFSYIDIVSLTKQSAARNRQYEVTGYLCYSNNTFFQYIEGEKPVVNRLLHQLREDKRHRFIAEVASDNHDVRLFSSWAMKYLTCSDLTEVHLDGFVSNSILYLKDNFSDKGIKLRLLWRQVMLISQMHDAHLARI